jgi:hypothetical protein
MVEAGFLYVGSQGILWSADHNKSVVKRAWLTDVALISRFICSRWVPDLEGYSAPGPPLVNRSEVCGQLTTAGSSTWSN